MPTRVRVTINDTMIDSLFLPGGDVWSKMQEMGLENMAYALEEVPRRTGGLAAQHNLALTPYKKRGVQYSVGNYADYAEYVHGGTIGPITAGFWDDGGVAYLGPMAPHMGRNALYARSVSGQAPNNWLERAGDRILLKYG